MVVYTFSCSFVQQLGFWCHCYQNKITHHFQVTLWEHSRIADTCLSETVACMYLLKPKDHMTLSCFIMSLTQRPSQAHRNSTGLKKVYCWVGVVGTVGKISAFWPQGPQFDTRLCQDLNWFVRLSFPPKLTQFSILPR